ncbi:hypothetical protein AMS68_003877 [Peltaster fructicola]|uniref:Small ribosomal subunit protein uS10m n=1 Tax=Peltaster fructicola TaxID=286661 RepID=A0A6H0XV87_9PEZI|nr:hypothetical protein AMS68_003877 [Peltaster fructicola]
MASSCCVESLVCSTKRLKISTPNVTSRRTLHCRSVRPGIPIASTTAYARSASQVANQPKQDVELRNLRLPKAVQAVFLTPLKRAPTHGIPVCDLQVRSYSVRNLEAFTDFCMRAAYYLNLPAKGPVPLPRITERWTVPRSHFIFKKSQENFERITVRRLIQIQDGHPDTVALWLAYIQKQRYYGVGMKANVFEHTELDALPRMDLQGEARLSGLWAGIKTRPVHEQLRTSKALDNQTGMEEAYNRAAIEEPFKAQWGAWAGMSGLDKTPTGRRRFIRRSLSAARAKASQSANVEAASEEVSV